MSMFQDDVDSYFNIGFKEDVLSQDVCSSFQLESKYCNKAPFLLLSPKHTTIHKALQIPLKPTNADIWGVACIHICIYVSREA